MNEGVQRSVGVSSERPENSRHARYTYLNLHYLNGKARQFSLYLANILLRILNRGTGAKNFAPHPQGKSGKPLHFWRAETLTLLSIPQSKVSPTVHASCASGTMQVQLSSKFDSRCIQHPSFWCLACGMRLEIHGCGGGAPWDICLRRRGSFIRQVGAAGFMDLAPLHRNQKLFLLVAHHYSLTALQTPYCQDVQHLSSHWG